MMTPLIPLDKIKAYIQDLQEINPYVVEIHKVLIETYALSDDKSECAFGCQLTPAIIRSCTTALSNNNIEAAAYYVSALQTEAVVAQTPLAQWDLLLSGFIREYGDQHQDVIQTSLLQPLIDKGYFRSLRAFVILSNRTEERIILVEIIDLLQRPLEPEARRMCWQAAMWIGNSVAFTHTKISRQIYRKMANDRPLAVNTFDLHRMEWRLMVLEDLKKMTRNQQREVKALLGRRLSENKINLFKKNNILLGALGALHRESYFRRKISTFNPGIADIINVKESGGALIVFMFIFGILFIVNYWLWDLDI